MKNKIICIVIGAVFILSGFGKVIDTADFRNLIAEYGLGMFKISAPFLTVVEIALGISLILYIKPKIMAGCSFVLLLIFTVAFTYAHCRYGINDCDCFGIFETKSQNNILLFYVRNIILLALSVFVWFSTTNETEKISEWKKMFFIGVLLPVIFVAGYTFRSDLSLQKEEHIFLNKNIKDTKLSEFIKTSKDSTYLLMWFSYSCKHCLNSIDNFKQYRQHSDLIDNVIAFALVGSDSIKNKEIRNTFTEQYGKVAQQEFVGNDDVFSFIKSVPTSFYIDNDTIKLVIQSKLPSVFNFEKLIKHY